MLAAALACLPPVRGQAQDPRAAGDEVIVQVRANGVEHGEFTLLRRPDGDFWIGAGDLPRLLVPAREQARRESAGQAWYSARELGAKAIGFDEARLVVRLDFQPDTLPGTRLDLASRAVAAQREQARQSLVLSYRLSLEKAGPATPQATLDTDLNWRVHGVLLRQEMHLRSAAARKFTRGATQVVWEDAANGCRLTVGDVFSSPGNYGSGITGAGLLLQKVYELTPDVVRQPTATLRTSSALPADVELSVDGTPVYRAHVAPGPITLDNLLFPGGVRTLRVTVTDAAGRREVLEQPFLFSDSVLARGLHEYSYFVGRRSLLDPANRWTYHEPAWQALHRYGWTERVTVSAGGEGSAGFRNLGAGATLRSDRLGLLGLDLLASTGSEPATHARGWSARYTYLAPLGSVVLARRGFGDGFRSFGTAADVLFPRSETRVGASTGIADTSLSADVVRTRTASGQSSSRFLRASTPLSRNVSLYAEYQTSRVDGVPGWSAAVYLRVDLDAQRWVTTSTRAEPQHRVAEVEAGHDLQQGEGLGWRLALARSLGGDRRDSAARASVDWRLRPVSLAALAVVPTDEPGSAYLRGEAAGALVAIDDYTGFTRRVGDAFALVRLGVPQAGVPVLLNSQLQGRTDAAGRLLLPELSSMLRQEVAIDERELDIQYTLAQKRRSIVPGYRSGSVVDFGIRKLRAVTGVAWLLRDGARTPVAGRTWTLAGPAGRVEVSTGSEGEFYVEDAPSGHYEGQLAIGERRWRCVLEVPPSQEPVTEVEKGIACE